MQFVVVAMDNPTQSATHPRTCSLSHPFSVMVMLLCASNNNSHVPIHRFLLVKVCPECVVDVDDGNSVGCQAVCWL
jgi:hypothetical protein